MRSGHWRWNNDSEIPKKNDKKDKKGKCKNEDTRESVEQKSGSVIIEEIGENNGRKAVQASAWNAIQFADEMCSKNQDWIWNL